MRKDLLDRLATIAQAPLLLVACDYDGTLAEIVADPAQAACNPEAVAALRSIGEISWTTNAIVSGRAFAELLRFVGPDAAAVLVGSHGAEWQRGGTMLATSQRKLLKQLAESVVKIAGEEPGLGFELKPAGVALHVRGVSRPLAAATIARAVRCCGDTPGVRVQHGSDVVEFMVVETNKADAVRLARHRCGATGVVFIGDDLTDEDVFRTLGPSDLGLRVGPGQTAAQHRVGGVPEVAEVLETLGSLRREWVKQRRLIALDRCAILSDQRTVAVVSPGATISWMCLPRIDSAALFASLVGGDAAGFFTIEPAEGSRSREAPTIKYDGSSFVLVTEWPSLCVTDYLDCSEGRAYQRAGRVDLVRIITGHAPARIRFAPRLDYGRVATRLRVHADGLEIEGSNDPIVLRSPGVAWTISNESVHQTAEAIVDPTAGPIVLELRYGAASLRATVVPEQTVRAKCKAFWSGWANALNLPSEYSAQVERSALVLKALTYGPSGAIAAAATTSLPEQLGGVRNWDYRYCWPRDGAMAAASLVRLGNTGHAMKFLDWVLEVVDRCESPDRLHPIYTVAGGHLAPEAELGHLAGFAGSVPVRIGNAAANQVQLDVFGPITNLVALLAVRGLPIAPDQWRLVCAMVRAVETRWSEPDHGIWEMRAERRHHVHSKVMCWHTVDRALVVEEAAYGTQNPAWITLRKAIRDDVTERGWNSKLGAYAGAYGYDYVDAAVLSIGLTGFMGAADSRWLATVELVRRELSDGHTVRRYLEGDGLAGEEGGMHVCTGWLIESLLTVGREAEARELLSKFAAGMSGPGILTEQVDPQENLAVGNLAQAYSHLAFINAVVALQNSKQITLAAVGTKP